MSGCSASEIVNTGGDTKCKDFLTQDEKKQNDEVSKMLKDKSGQDPTNLEITATKARSRSIARRSARKTRRSQRHRTAERVTAAVWNVASLSSAQARSATDSPVRHSPGASGGRAA